MTIYPVCKDCGLWYSVQVLADQCEARHEREANV